MATYLNTILTSNIRDSRFRFSFFLPLFAILFSAYALFTMPGDSVCAGVKSPSDYCYQRDVNVTYNGTGTLNNKSIRIDTDSQNLINAGYVGDNVWEIFGIQGSLSNTISILAQDITSLSAGWWYQIPEVSAGESVTLRLYMQNPEQQRDQGILFEGDDSLSVAHAPVMNITNNLDVEVDLTFLDGDRRSSGTATVLSHYDSATSLGYKLEIIPDTASDNINLRATANNEICETTLPPSINFNSPDRYNFKFNSPNIILEKNGSVLFSCATSVLLISGVLEPLNVGNDLDHTIIRNINLQNSGAVVGRWLFEPSSMTETSALDPIYQGTALDRSVNNLDFSYTFNRDQSDYVTTITPIHEVGVTTIIPMPTDTVDVLGTSPWGGSISTPVPGQTTGVFYDLVTAPLTVGNTIDAPSGMVMTMILGGIGMFLAIVVFMRTSFIPLSLFMAGIPLSLGAVNGWVSFWIPIFFALLVVLSWFSLRGADGY